MSTFRPLKSTLAIAALLAASSGFAADRMSKEEHKAAKDQIEASYKSSKAACDKLEANAKDVCNAEAKAKEKVALAELDARRSGKDSDRTKAARVKAEQDYEVAKERCEDKAKAEQDACKKEAKATQDKALAELKGTKAAQEKAQNKADRSTASKS